MKENLNLLRLPRGSGKVAMLRIQLLALLVLFAFTNVQGQQRSITGTVVDENNEPVIGATVLVKGTQIGEITNLDGYYEISVPASSTALVFSYVGMEAQEVNIEDRVVLNVTLTGSLVSLDDVVVVGYGTQKKASIVGAITQVKGDDIQKSGGVSTISQAIEGQIPGMVTMYTGGQPGVDNMRIYLRGQSSWNGSGQPLILVDGIERSMNDIDLNEVESISVLKDASATAVFGVKGGNGVILITTKRGQVGKAQLSISGNITGKSISKVPEKYDAYDAMMIANEAITREMMYAGSWGDYTPLEIADRYRNQATQLDQEIYPNVDWKDYMFKDMASDGRLNVSVRGGSNVAKYFVNLAYQHEGDIVKDFDNSKGYSAHSSYDRFTYRSNLDFSLSKTTKLAVNLSGLYGVRDYPKGDVARIYLSLYNLAPDLYYPRYSDGAYGWSGQNDMGTSNSLYYYTTTGMNYEHRFSLNTDLELTQDFDFITPGLKFRAKFSMDNSMTGSQEIDDSDNVIFKRYRDDGQDIHWKYPDVDHDYEYVIEPWEIGSFNVGGNKMRRIDYQMTLNYDRTFNDVHNVSALALFKRQQYASGSMFPRYTEDWVTRLTYNYKEKYLFEASGAYNGSEKFGPGYRFELFPSVSLGWVISEESFMENLEWLDKFKVRGSYGLVGDDSFSGRWLYVSQWKTSTQSVAINSSYYDKYTNGAAASPYKFYYEDIIGNPDVHWETAKKMNLGLELSFFKGAITFDGDYFQNHRFDIYIDGDDRAMPDWYGSDPPGANVGETEVKGYEFELGLNHRFDNTGRIWAKVSMGHAKDVVLFRDDPGLRPDYQKMEGYSIGQTHMSIPTEIMQSWDDVYMSTPLVSGNASKRVGYYDLIDFNGDGNYNGTFDNVPWGYPNRPQNTYSWTFGANYRGFSFTAQLYAQQNTLRNQRLSLWPLQTHNFYTDFGDYWSKDNADATMTLRPWTETRAYSDPLQQWRDGTTVRLKMLEFAYRLPTKSCDRIGVEGLKVFANGNNLFLWSKMADDRDFSSGNRGDYPTLKRFNIGFQLDL